MASALPLTTAAVALALVLEGQDVDLVAAALLLPHRKVVHLLDSVALHRECSYRRHCQGRSPLGLPWAVAHWVPALK